MEDAARFRLLGKYRTPRFRIGQRVRCQVRGEMIVTGMTEEDDQLVRTLSVEEAARRTGRSLMSIYKRRYRLHVPDGRTKDAGNTGRWRG